jgi:shikimate dehydrogenase
VTGPVRLALIGSGIKMSMAKAFHERAGVLSGLDVSYDLIERDAASRDDIPRLIARCHHDGYAALNVTYPFKEVAFGCVTIEDPSVQHIGAVNTVVFGAGGSTVGWNTDYSGLVRRWHLRWPDEPPGVVALIGAGGVGRSTAFALAELGASVLRIADTNPDRVRALADALAGRFPDLPVVVAPSAESAVDRADGVVNATPVGMYFNPGTPVDLSAIGDQRWVLDVVYSPIETPLVMRAEDAGMAVMNGFELFLGQGFDSFQRFTGRPLAPDAAEELEAVMWQQVTERRQTTESPS